MKNLILMRNYCVGVQTLFILQMNYFFFHNILAHCIIIFVLSKFLLFRFNFTLNTEIIYLLLALIHQKKKTENSLFA